MTLAFKYIPWHFKNGEYKNPKLLSKRESTKHQPLARVITRKIKRVSSENSFSTFYYDFLSLDAYECLSSTKRSLLLSHLSMS
jgi:hypothetical protein